MQFEPPRFDEIKQTPPSFLSQILSEIGYYLGLALISLFLAYVLYFAIKKAIHFLIFLKKKITGLLDRIFNPETLIAGYNDEITSLLKEGESILVATRKWLASVRATDRPYMLLRNNRERARWLYKKIVRKALGRGLALSGAMTSREVLSKIGAINKNAAETTADTASNIYNSARYGNSDPEDSEIEILKAFHS